MPGEAVFPESGEILEIIPLTAETEAANDEGSLECALADLGYEEQADGSWEKRPACEG